MGQSQSQPSRRPHHLMPLVTHEPPYISECEVLHEGGLESCELFENCEKNPEHLKFIPANEFQMSHLPPEFRTEKRLKHIKNCCDRTVRVVVKYTSTNRPDTFPNSTAQYPFSKFKGSSHKKRLGTGFVASTAIPCVPGRLCPCHLCRNSDHPKSTYFETIVSTAAHVVFDDSEARHAVFELFYDSEERDNVKYLYGVEIFDGRSDQQRCDEDHISIFCASHDMELATTISKEMAFKYKDISLADESFGIVISHPHGAKKHITSGYFLRREAPMPNFDFVLSARKRPQTLFKRIFCKPVHSNVQSEFAITACRLPLKAPDPPKKLFRELSAPRSDQENITKKAYELNKNAKISFPANALYLCSNGILERDWYTFYPGTSVFRDGSDEWLIPPEMEFHFMPGKTRKMYDISTCPGCSGAPAIRYINGLHSDFIMTHAGAMGDGTNRSVLEYMI